MALRVVFMGTPLFARASLAALIDSPHQVVAVVSQPDRRGGRGKRLVSPPVAELAREADIPLMQPASVKTRAFRRALAAFEPDIGVVAAYGHILGPRALAVPRLGCINVHASLLPRWRGASPIAMAIASGDAESGVTIMQMDAGMDTGAILLARRVAIGPDDTGHSLQDTLARLGAGALIDALDGLEQGSIVAKPQPAEGVTYAPLFDKRVADLDWHRPATELERAVRAFHPWPGSRAWLGDEALKVLPPARITDADVGSAPPGTVIAAGPQGVDVATGDGVLRLLRLQAPGRRALDVADFLSGYTLASGMRFAARPSDPA